LPRASQAERNALQKTRCAPEKTIAAAPRSISVFTPEPVSTLQLHRLSERRFGC
jgi:hypothetical protein